MAKGEPGIARARLPARPRAKNRAIWLNQVPDARTLLTGHARARLLPGLKITRPARYLAGSKSFNLMARNESNFSSLLVCESSSCCQ